MMSTTAADRRPWFKRWWVWVVGVVGVLVLVSAIGNLLNPGARDAAAPESSSTAVAAPTAQAVVTPTPENVAPAATETAEPEVSPEELNATAFEALRAQFGGVDPVDAFSSDPSLWYGWITSTRVEGANFIVTLQVGAGDSERDDLGERAASAIANLLAGDAADGLDWVVVEDASGVVIDQKMTS